ncbi:hypothetical protein LTR36_008653 [Oleoguttula mirabilis]|uniref:Uncharacterized protein n=1 Tax=Oleoguttula mirabilis TaxID=1507867 RepID=A0AAV9JUC9_9PEZI|nr:hypothetical protein LTR36_008653 [Oleoguttula mirabilis]
MRHLRIWPTYFADTFDRADLYRSAIYIDRSKQTAATHEELRAFTEDCRLEHLDAFVEQQNRIDDGRDVILLRDAFSGLSSLKSITIGCLDAGCGDDKHKEIVIPSTAQQLSSNCSMRRKGKGDKARRNALSCTFITVIKAVVWTKKPLEALTVGIGRCHEQLSDYVQLKALHHATGMIDQVPGCMHSLRNLDLMIELPQTVTLPRTPSMCVRIIRPESTAKTARFVGTRAFGRVRVVLRSLIRWSV